jgi:predicted fused transcriptional regulator/phosphomethylpyrimidine kinase/predicted transcriptional regulator
VRFVEEVVVERFLPTYRSMLAAALRERGLTQQEVADALGVSQSAVSKYGGGAVERTPAIAEDERVRETVERVADGLAEGGLDRVGALVESEVLVRRLEADVLARLHEEAMPELAGRDHAIHDPERVRERERTLAALRRGLDRVERMGGVATLVPAVGSNLVAAVPDPSDLGDVAGVPGRIVDVKGRATVPAEPEFGVSEHVGTVLLAAREAGSEALAAANVRYDEALVATLSTEGATPVEFDPADGLEAGVRAALDRAPAADVLYHTGAFGVEPVVYLLGPDVERVVDRLEALA